MVQTTNDTIRARVKQRLPVCYKLFGHVVDGREICQRLARIIRER